MKQLSANAFNKYLSNEIKDNLFVIYGEERFFFDLLLEKLENIVFSNKPDKDLNYHVFYGTEDSVSEVLATCLSYPMLANHKMVVVKEFDKLQIDDKESFLKYILYPQSSTILILLAEKFGGNKFHKEIMQSAVSIRCRSLQNGEIYKWTTEKFKNSNIKVNRDSIAFLIENIGSNILRLNLEIDKIKSYVSPGETLTLEKIAQISGFTRDVNIFNFQNVLASQNLKVSLKIGYHLLEQGEMLAAILPMIINFFRKMWVVKQLAGKNYSRSKILNEVGATEYAYRNIFAHYDNFSFNHIELIFHQLLNSEIQLKTSQKSPESIITILCYIICTPKKN